MDSRTKKLLIFALVTFFVIFIFLALYFELRDLIFEDIRLPYTVETACSFSSRVTWC